MNLEELEKENKFLKDKIKVQENEIKMLQEQRQKSELNKAILGELFNVKFRT